MCCVWAERGRAGSLFSCVRACRVKPCGGLTWPQHWALTHTHMLGLGLGLGPWAIRHTLGLRTWALVSHTGAGRTWPPHRPLWDSVPLTVLRVEGCSAAVSSSSLSSPSSSSSAPSYEDPSRYFVFVYPCSTSFFFFCDGICK